MMRIGSKGLALVKSFESFIPYPYDDLIAPVNGVYREWKGGPVRGTLTIGYGHTDVAKYPLKIVPGLRLAEAQALDILDVDMDECEADVNRLVKRPLTQGQFDALASFTFNCGAGALKNIADRINRGAWEEARNALDLYVKSKGKVLRGLQRRRDAEQALWDEGNYLKVSLPAPMTIEGIALPEPGEIVHHTAEVDSPAPEGPSPADTAAGGLVAALLWGLMTGARVEYVVIAACVVVAGWALYRIYKAKRGMNNVG